MAEAVEHRAWGKIALLSCAAILLLGWASGWLSNSGYGNSWFDGLRKPSFMPPAWLFPVAWTILYLLMGISLAMMLSLPWSRRRRAALILFFAQLALNLSWSPLFFAAHDIRLAKFAIFVMALLAAAAAGQFARLWRPAGLFLIPYIVWLIFAATLNSAIDSLNPGAGSSLLG